MAKKILIDAGHFSNYNQSKVYKNYYEGNSMWSLHNYLKKELEAYGFIVHITRTSRDKDLNVYNRGLLAKGYDLFISLHSNACDDEKVDRVVIIKGYDQGDKLPSMLGEGLSQVIGVKQKYQIMTRKGSNGGEYYGVLRGAKAVGVKDRFIIEHGFHTNTNTAKWLYQEANLKKLAKKEAEIIAEYYGVKKNTSSNTNINTNKVLYKVCIASYKDKTNANIAVKEAIKKGYKDAYALKADNGYYRILIGTYSVKEYANNAIKEAEKKGYKGAFIV